MNFTETPHESEILLSEGSRSRDQGTVTVAANTTLKPGQVMEVSAGKYVTLATSTNAAGILYGELKNDTAAPVDMKGAVINRDAEIRTASLVWPEGWTSANWTASLVALRALGLIARP